MSSYDGGGFCNADEDDWLEELRAVLPPEAVEAAAKMLDHPSCTRHPNITDR